MPMLGDILAAARGASASFEAWLAASDPVFAGEIAEAAAQAGLNVAALARIVVHDFATHASEEDWATLMSALRDSEDPGTVCLLAMLQWRLTAPACPAHSGPHPHVHPEGAGDARRLERQGG